ncbi:MAG: zinc ribbon domain-containing protein [Gemmatimonadales bacterium]|nr:zinc ribbon domain-containing protein [Gemmatimonadales bacterium]
MTDSTTRPCPSCGTVASGNFCSSCGLTLRPRACLNCQAELSPQARFCHRCGTSVGGPASGARLSATDRKAWTLAGILCLLLVGGIAYNVSRADSRPRSPDMANAGSSTGLSGAAPDISALTPRERFDRLFNRIMQASERRDSAEIERFTPMALGAYQQLDAVDVDARYHAAVLQLQIRELPAAKALADTILAESPGHLFGYVIRGEVAKVRNDSLGRAQAERDFLSHYGSAMQSKRVEYLEHKPVLDEFKAQAESVPLPSSSFQ